MARAKYQPPQQSIIGQVVDAALVLIAVFLALWVPLYFNLAGAATRTILPAGVTQQTAADGTVTFPGATWEISARTPSCRSSGKHSAMTSTPPPR